MGIRLADIADPRLRAEIERQIVNHMLVPVRTDETKQPANESDLHDEIIDYCRSKGWIALHGSTARRTHRTVGEWDFIILAEYGSLYLVEVKSRTGKVRPEQAALHAQAEKLGFKTFIVRSLQEFVEIVK